MIFCRWKVKDLWPATCLGFHWRNGINKEHSSALQSSMMKCLATFLITMPRNRDRSGVPCVSLLKCIPKHGSTYPSTSAHTLAKWSSGSYTAHPSLRRCSLMKRTVFSSKYSRHPCLHSMQTENWFTANMRKAHAHSVSGNDFNIALLERSPIRIKTDNMIVQLFTIKHECELFRETDRKRWVRKWVWFSGCLQAV